MNTSDKNSRYVCFAHRLPNRNFSVSNSMFNKNFFIPLANAKDAVQQWFAYGPDLINGIKRYGTAAIKDLSSLDPRFRNVSHAFVVADKHGENVALMKSGGVASGLMLMSKISPTLTAATLGAKGMLIANDIYRNPAYYQKLVNKGFDSMSDVLMPVANVINPQTDPVVIKTVVKKEAPETK